MEYNKKILLSDGRSCTIRNGTREDGQAALENFIAVHGQTDFLLTYPDEISFSVEEEAEYIAKKAQSDNEAELIAEVDGVIAGTAGIQAVGSQEKLKYRATFGISLDKKFWGLGIGRAMTRACIECAKKAGYKQLELDVVADNERAAALYLSEGFVEYGRNPRGFHSRCNGWQELILMRLEL